jgi:hypothetical protein
MRLRTVLLMGLLTATGLVAQEKAAEAKPEAKATPEEAVIIPVKTLSGDSFNRLAKMLGVFQVKYVADEKLRTILVYGPPAVISQMKRVVEELDRPGSEAAIGRNIEMTMTFLRCSTKSQADSGALPTDLDSVARQLRSATPYKSIEVWDIVPLRLREGKETYQQLRLPTSNPELPAIPMADLKISPEAVIRKESSRYVRFDHMNIGFRIPYATSPFKNTADNASPLVSTQFNMMSLALNTSGDFKEGQKTVLGKLSMEDETAIFVVVSLKVLD